MKTNTTRFLPEARRDGIIVRDVEGEVLVYDLERDKAHCLNSLAANIWRYCDGRTTISEIAASLPHQEGTTVDDQVVLLGLEELRRSHLLVEPNAPAEWFPKTGMSRREAVRRIGLGAAIALPLIASMTVPTAVEAAVSCGARCKPCNTASECCNGVCTSGLSGCPPGGNRCA
ncbi:MAG TPA: PqqD family protein [Pyrinomonadaceae bacterium]|nr:PqqD family protein [Pyrinomonadaceae bacterium]